MGLGNRIKKGTEYCNMCQTTVPQEQYHYDVDMCYWCIIKLRKQFKACKKKK